MVSIDKVVRKFAQLDEYQVLLARIAEKSEALFLADKLLVGSAKYYLQVSIECCLDVANHVIASEKFRPPQDYADSFRILQENGLIVPKLAVRLRQMAKFRNRLVHLYGEVDDAFVYGVIKNDLGDFEQFKAAVLDFIKK